MDNNNQCRAVKRDGNRCTNRTKFGHFCGRHLPTPRKDRSTLAKIGKGIKTLTEIAVVAGAAIKLVEKVVEVWQSLPFGPAPRMPRDYDYLVAQLGPIYPNMPDRYRPFSKGPDSVDWQRARQIYDTSKALLSALEAGTGTPETLAPQFAQLDRVTTELFDSMQEPLQRMLYEQIGREPEDDDNSTEMA